MLISGLKRQAVHTLSLEHTLAIVRAKLASFVANGTSSSSGPIISHALDTQIFKFMITVDSIAPCLEYA